MQDDPELLVPHCDPNVNLYDRFYCTRGVKRGGGVENSGSGPRLSFGGTTLRYLRQRICLNRNLPQFAMSDNITSVEEASWHRRSQTQPPSIGKRR